MDRVAALLARFPGPLVLRPSKGKWFALLAAAGLFTAAGFVENINAGSTGFLDWIGVAFFGLCTVGFAFMIFFARLEMTLDGDGFGWRAARLSERWRWIDVGDFAVVDYSAGMPGAALRKRVGFNDKRPDKKVSQTVGELFSTAMTGRDCAVPDTSGFSSFGLPMEDLVRLMAAWQERAIALRRAKSALN
jgi:hypothetical protein